MHTPLSPIRLTPNSVPSFYPGAGRVADFRRDTRLPRTDPEDWIASTASRTGLAPSGLTTLPDGSDLAGSIAGNPLAWLGGPHLDRYGPSTGLLVKLLDAGRRLPLHIHPTTGFAGTHLDSPYGKTEAWIILDAEPGAYVHLGFNRDIDAAELHRWVVEQDTRSLLAATNTVPVAGGDVLLCPAGVPHAIGEGILTLELQEPTDFSIMLEWEGYPLDPGSAFLGLDRVVALSAVHRGALDARGLDELRGRTVPATVAPSHATTSLLPAAADDFFTAVHVTPGSGHLLDQRLSLLVALAGAGALHSADCPPLPVAAGDTYLIPYSAGATELSGALSVIRCHAA